MELGYIDWATVPNAPVDDEEALDDLTGKKKDKKKKKDKLKTKKASKSKDKAKKDKKKKKDKRVDMNSVD